MKTDRRIAFAVCAISATVALAGLRVATSLTGDGLCCALLLYDNPEIPEVEQYYLYSNCVEIDMANTCLTCGNNGDINNPQPVIGNICP